MSNRNAPGGIGGYMSGFSFGAFGGASEPESAQARDRAQGHAPGAAAANRNPTELPKGKANWNTAANPAGAANRNPQEQPVIPGLAELVEVLNAMAAAPLGTRPKINTELIEKIKNSPLHPVLGGLQPIFKKLGPKLEGSPEHQQAQAQAQAEAAQRGEAHPSASQPESAPGPGPSSVQPEPPQLASTPASHPSSVHQPPPTPAALDIAELKKMEAALSSLSAKLDFVSHAVTDVTTRTEMGGNFQTLENKLRQADSDTREAVREAVKASANATKTQVENVDKKVAQMTDKLDPVLAELAQGVKKLQIGLRDDAKAERARFEAKVKELEKEVNDLHQVIDDTRAELLPVETASKMVLQGSLSEEPDKKDSRGGNDNATPNLLQTAKKVRANMSGLMTKCRALFAFIHHDPETEADVPEIGKEGEWGRCVQHLLVSNSKLRNAVAEKEESDKKLQFVGFVVEQIRQGHYTKEEWESDTNWNNFLAVVEKSPDGFESIQLLAEDLSRLTTQASTPTVPDGPASPTVSADSNTSTAKPINESSEALAAPVESFHPLTSTPAVTAPSSPAAPVVPIPAKKEQGIRPTPTKKRSSTIRIKMVFNPNPGPLYGWGPIVSPK
ncbi:hypothetical protein FS837_011105 [Tulasnella sp. UAMH 9824]|nr:hypothetical protein FS837_011105 [Tulasnella sp. UAMH 9824]